MNGGNLRLEDVSGGPSSCGPELAAPQPSVSAAAPGADSAGPAAALVPPEESLIPPIGVAAHSAALGEDH